MKRRLGVGLVSAATAVLAAWSAPVHAGDGSEAGGVDTEGGYGAYAVSLSGDYSPGLVATVSKPAPLCWWEPWPEPGNDVDPDDAKAIEKWWFEEIRPWLTGSDSAAGQLMVASEEEFANAVAADKEGLGVTWYSLEVNDAALPSTSNQAERVRALVDAGCGSVNDTQYMGDPVLVSVRYFPFRAPPEPQVDAELLADYAYKVMDLAAPTLDWNPKIGPQQDATLVNLPTWMWAEDAEAVETQTVTATAGTVSVTVTAKTGGLSITSPAGSTECGPERASRAYKPGRDDDSACTVAFNRGSYGYPDGFPVDASTAWTASWTSNVGREGDLAPRTVAETTYIPVAESQALVTEVD